MIVQDDDSPAGYVMPISPGWLSCEGEWRVWTVMVYSLLGVISFIFINQTNQRGTTRHPGNFQA